jgi:hypothetical protein
LYNKTQIITKYEKKFYFGVGVVIDKFIATLFSSSDPSIIESSRSIVELVERFEVPLVIVFTISLTKKKLLRNCKYIFNKILVYTI